MLTKSGANLMGFGLAKAVSPAAAPLSSSLTLSINNPGASEPVTAKGTLVGTVQHMSLEQLEGKEFDTRSDIFALAQRCAKWRRGRKCLKTNRRPA